MGVDLLIISTGQPKIPRYWGDSEVIEHICRMLADSDLTVVDVHVETETQLKHSLEEHQPKLSFTNGYRLLNEMTQPFMAGIIDQEGYAFIGSDAEGLLCISKSHTKKLLLQASISTPCFLVARQSTFLSETIKGLSFPLVVKPAEGAESIAISPVGSFEELEKAVADILNIYPGEVVIEEWKTRVTEYTVAVIGNDLERAVLPITLSIPEGAPFLTNHVKENRIEDTIRGIPTDDVIYRLAEVLNAACDVLKIRDWARFDVLHDESDNLWIIDVNAIPGLRLGPKHPSYFPRCIHYHLGFSYEDTIIALLAVASRRTSTALSDKLTARSAPLLKQIDDFARRYRN